MTQHIPDTIFIQPLFTYHPKVSCMPRGEKRTAFWSTASTVVALVVTILVVPLSLDFPTHPALNFESKSHLHESINSSPLLIAGQRAIPAVRTTREIVLHVVGVSTGTSEYLDGKAIADPFNHVRFRILYSRFSAADL